MAEAAVAVGLGASVISFIGLTGQILQGCKVVCDCLDDIKEAPKEIQYTLDQLKHFESEIRNLQYTLEKTRQSTDILHFEEHIKSSLELSESVINDLRDLVGRYKRDGKKDWWKNFKFTKKKNTFTKYINRLNEAKIIIINVKSSLTMDLILDTHRMMVAAPSVQPMPSVSTTITTQTHQVSSKQYTQSSTQTCRDVTHAVHDSLDARLDPFSAKIVKSSVDIALKDFILNRKSNTGTQIPDSDLLGNGRPMPTTGDCNGGFFGGVSRPRVISQTTTNRIINAWLATIVIRSTTTNLQEIFEENKTTAEEPLVTSRTIHRIDIHPNYFVRARYLVFMEQKSGSIFACSDMRLKCYNNVPRDAPIIEACSKGDLSMVRRLFAEGKASPHDIVISSERSAPSTLLFRVWEYCYITIQGINRELPCHHRISRSLIYLNKLFGVLEYLVEQGIDPADCTPNHGTYPLSLFWRVVAELFGCHPLVVPLLEQLIRLILKKSLNDPFGYIAHPASRTWSGLQYSMVAQFIDCVQTQEIWPFTGIESTEDELVLSGKVYDEGTSPLREPPYALISDPQGMYIRRVIRCFKFSDFCMESYCMEMLTASTRLNKNKEDDNVQLAVRSRIFQCLRAGMKLNHISRCEHIIGGRTLYSLCKHMGKLNFLRSILHDTGYNDVEIDAMFEDSRYIMLEASLNSLRPSRIIEEGICIARRNDDRSLGSQRLLASKMLMLDPEYQKFFPDEGKLDRNVETYFPREYDPEGEGWRKFKDELFNHYTITWRNEDDYILISLLPQETQTILRNDLGLSK